MIKYKHFIITFFNIRLVEQWHEDKKNYQHKQRSG